MTETIAMPTHKDTHDQARSERPAQAAPAGRLVRVACFAYGLVAYVGFLATFLYTLGFVSGLLVPKGINGGAVGPVGTAVLVNVGLLSLFAVQHTIMARLAYKRWWGRILPQAIERSTFVVATCVVLSLLFWQWRPLPTVLWNIEQPLLRGALYALSASGYLIVLVSTFLIDHFDLFGLRQVTLALRGRPYSDHPFANRGFYRYIRHPLMLGFLIAFWFTPTMTVGHLLFAGVVTAYILVAVRIEERTLIGILGDDYVKYREVTPALLPFGRRS